MPLDNIAPTAHMRATLNNTDPIVHALDDVFPGRYAINFGDVSIHCTLAQWAHIDTVVRNTIREGALR